MTRRNEWDFRVSRQRLGVPLSSTAFDFMALVFVVHAGSTHKNRNFLLLILTGASNLPLPSSPL